MRTPAEDARDAYESADARARLIRGTWEEMGCPVTEMGGATGRATVTHPLLRTMVEAESLADRLRQSQVKAHRGPEPRAVVQSKIGRSPAAKLRAVEDE